MPSASYTSRRLSRAVSAVLNNTSSLCLPVFPSFYPVRCLRYPLLASHPLFLITHQVIVSSTDHNNIVLPHYTLSTPTHSQATSNNPQTPPHPAPSYPSCVFLKGDLTNTQDAYEDNVIVCYIHGFEGQLCEYVKGWVAPLNFKSDGLNTVAHFTVKSFVSIYLRSLVLISL